MTAKSIPEGHRSLTPNLTVDNGLEALTFNANAEPIPWRCSRRLSGGSGRGVGVLHGGRERLGALLRRRGVHPHDLPAVAVEIEEAA